MTRLLETLRLGQVISAMGLLLLSFSFLLLVFCL